ncbi:MAG: hypothetical protein M4579_007003 [Chaenotheca gracillima]|nr:MAG: hypothetical protein M4579_007003 [Chaenotheca gracillima]
MTSTAYKSPLDNGHEHYRPGIQSEKIVSDGSNDQIPPYEHGDEFGARRSSSVYKPRIDSTHRKLKPRHIQLIGIGGTIGTTLFVQIGQGLLKGGPGSLFIAFTFCREEGQDEEEEQASVAREY